MLDQLSSNRLLIIPSKFENHSLGLEAMVTGMGKINVVHKLTSYLEWNKVKVVILAGYCGGLRGLSVGDIVEPTILIEGDYNCDPIQKYPNLIDYCHGKLLPNSKRVAFVSQDRFLTYDPYMRTIRNKVLATDMESYAAAYICREYKVRFHCVKIVSDVVGSNSTSDFLGSCKSLNSLLKVTIKKAISEI